MLRTLSSTVVRTVPRRAVRASRGFAAHAGRVEQLVIEGKPNKEWVEYRKNIEHHAGQTKDLWQKICFFIAVPASIAGIIWAYRVESEHSAHEEHIKAEHGGHLPPPPGYDYLNKRGKPFPWGKNSLFFNPHTNKDMTDASE